MTKGKRKGTGTPRPVATIETASSTSSSTSGTLTEPVVQGVTDTEVPTTGVAAMHAMRAARKHRRLGNIEWFDAAYRVYVVALFGGGALLWLSGLVGDGPLDAQQAANVAKHGPVVLGMVAVLAFAAGLRSGSQGGPLALEAADVSHVMLAPIPRRTALMRPTIQRVRGAAFAGAAIGAIFGQMAGRRLPGSALAWFGSGALFGANAALLWVGAALLSHALRVKLTISTLIAAVFVAWQGIAIATDIPGPADVDGSLALWGWRQHPIDVLALVFSAALVLVGITMVARTSLEALARRASLVAQLRFAVTMQDLRTVILLRRQLSHEHTRRHPWFRVRPRSGGDPVWRRGLHSIVRFPTGRVVRMVALAAAAGACQVAAFHGTTPAIVGTMALLFVLGLESMEPLSQEIDQPDRTDSFPMDRGDLLFRHLRAPAVVLIPFAVIGAASAVITDAIATHGDRIGVSIAVASILAIPTVFAGAAGAAVSIVRDAPDPMSSSSQQSFMPPEMAGFTTVLRTLVPLLVSAAGMLSVLIVRGSVSRGDAAVPSAVRAAIGVSLLVAGTAVWVRHRDQMHKKFRSFMDEGKAYGTQQRSTR
ncbi:MAG: hypothetical protein JWN99_668 [Ilumatobacteraceae bacterium]|nr:hypothetical protein [Ilumatobacteraceae bacterium]